VVGQEVMLGTPGQVVKLSQVKLCQVATLAALGQVVKLSQVKLRQVATLAALGQVVKLSQVKLRQVATLAAPGQVVRTMERMKGAKVGGKPREDAQDGREKARDDGELRRKQLRRKAIHGEHVSLPSGGPSLLGAKGPLCMGLPYFLLKNNENEKSSETEKREIGRDRVDNGSTGEKFLVLFLPSHIFSLPPVYQSCHGWNELPVKCDVLK
jgi:hypothetical protein